MLFQVLLPQHGSLSWGWESLIFICSIKSTPTSRTNPEYRKEKSTKLDNHSIFSTNVVSLTYRPKNWASALFLWPWPNHQVLKWAHALGLLIQAPLWIASIIQCPGLKSYFVLTSPPGIAALYLKSRFMTKFWLLLLPKESWIFWLCTACGPEELSAPGSVPSAARWYLE